METLVAAFVPKRIKQMKRDSKLKEFNAISLTRSLPQFGAKRTLGRMCKVSRHCLHRPGYGRDSCQAASALLSEGGSLHRRKPRRLQVLQGRSSVIRAITSSA